jgi:hypothetical protein
MRLRRGVDAIKTRYGRGRYLDAVRTRSVVVGRDKTWWKAIVKE